MKKISQILAILAIVLAPFAVGGNAFASSTCPVGYTGPDSNNMCISETKTVCTIDNNNTVTINDSSLQFTQSGDASNTSNNGTGSSITGTATNSNNQTFNVTVTNSAVSDGNKTCVAVATIPATIVKPAAAVVSGGSGAVAATKEVTPTVLPKTSGNEFSNYLVTSATVLGAGAIITYLVAVAYRRWLI